MKTYGQYVWAGDGDDLVDFGDSWYGTYGYGGQGNDTFNLPIRGVFNTVRGGDGDDHFMTDKDYGRTDAAGPPSTIVTIYGDAGNDKMELDPYFRSQLVYGYGGTGDDKIIYPHNASTLIAGEDGDDIIYGDSPDDGTPFGGVQAIYGDELTSAITADASLATVGGDDKLYGSDF